MVDMRTHLGFHADMLALLAMRMKPAIYLELGVWCGVSLKAVAPYCLRVISVDNGPEAGSLSASFPGEFYPMTTDAFFSGPGRDLTGVELTFIDADHECGQVMKDFRSSFARSAVNGLICLHDTFPEDDSYKVVGHCADSYLVPGMIRDEFLEPLAPHDAELVTLPCPPGLTIVRKLR